MRLSVAAALLACALLGASRLATAAPAPAPADCPPVAEVLTPEERAAGLRDAADAGFLWRIRKDGRTSWLYGTIHLAQRAWMFPGPHVAAALRASDAVALELDPTDPEIVARLMRRFTRPPGAPELAPDLAARLRRQLVAACLDPAQLALLRPEVRAVTVDLLSARRLGLQQEYGVDIVIAQLANDLHKQVLQLETPELQAALLVSDDPRETARQVGDVLDELEQGRAPQVLSRLAQDWHDGRLADLEAYASWCDCMGSAAQRADFVKLVDERNPPMADRIAAWHAEGRALFVAVGSLHMAGPVGLPALLRAKGFEVQRVDFALPLP